MAVPDRSTWTPTAQRRDAPMTRFNNVHANATEIIWQLARHLEAITHRLGCWVGRGWDTSGEHGTGRALDWMISATAGVKATPTEREIGDAVVDWLIQHSDALRIRHIIWNRRIWKRRYRHTKTAWTAIRNRRGVSDWHEDHIHIYLDNAGGHVPDAPLTTVSPAQEGILAMDINQPIPGTEKLSTDGKPLTAGQCLLRGAWAYQQTINSGSIAQRLRRVEALVKARTSPTGEARAQYAYDTVTGEESVVARLDALEAALMESDDDLTGI